MTRNEALEKIREFFIDNKGHVKNWSGYNTNDVSDMILKFFEDELGMKQVIIKERCIEEKPFKLYIGSIARTTDFYVGWDEEK